MPYHVWAVGPKDNKIYSSGNIFVANSEEEKRELAALFSEDGKAPKEVYSRMIRRGSETLRKAVERIESGDYPEFIHEGITPFLREHDCDLNFFFSVTRN
jgi:hypothetical protein